MSRERPDRVIDVEPYDHQRDATANENVARRLENERLAAELAERLRAGGRRGRRDDGSYL